LLTFKRIYEVKVEFHLPFKFDSKLEKIVAKVELGITLRERCGKRRLMVVEEKNDK